METDEPVKMMLCQLLHHLCDCQLENRVEHLVRFSESYILELQKDQKKRSEAVGVQLTGKVLRELKTPTAKQVWTCVCVGWV